jgi:hypothetical protein
MTAEQQAKLFECLDLASGRKLTVRGLSRSLASERSAPSRVADVHLLFATLLPVFQALPGASFIVNGATLPKNSALTTAGAELRLANGISLLAKFDGEFASHSSTYAGSGILRYTW